MCPCLDLGCDLSRSLGSFSAFLGLSEQLVCLISGQWFLVHLCLFVILLVDFEFESAQTFVHIYFISFWGTSGV